MHEFSVVFSILEELEKISRSNGNKDVVRVDLVIGVLEHIEPEVLRSVFDQAKEGSCAERAELFIRLEEAMVRCRECRSEYVPEADVWLCPQCGSVGGEIISGTEVVIESVYME